MRNNDAAVTSRRKVLELTEMSIFTAIILIMAFTPIGLIDLPLIKATILHVPVIIGCILMGPKKGAFLGFLFGLTSFIKNMMAPSVLSFAFTPFVEVPGTGHGSPWAIVICFLPRILVGVIPYFVYVGLKKLLGKHAAARTVSLAVSGAAGALTNTILVMGLIFILFRDAYAAANGIDVSAVQGVILGIIAGNGVPEAIVAAVFTPVIVLALRAAGLFREARV